MSLFNKESREEKQQQRAQELLAQFGLENLNDETSKIACLDIMHGLAGNKLMDIGAALQGNSSDVAKQTYLRALVEQNFIIIKQLDRLLSK